MNVGTTPSLLICAQATLNRVRKLPADGKPCVKIGDMVAPDDVVGRAFLPGEVHSVGVSSILGTARTQTEHHMLIETGESVSKGQTIALSSSLFGLLKSRVKSPVCGVLESVSNVSGHAMIRQDPIPVEVKAFVSGTVTRVDRHVGVEIQARASLIQGVFGVGAEVWGKLISLEQKKHATESQLADSVIYTGESLSLEVMRELAESRVLGIVAPSVDGAVLNEFVGRQLNLAATGDEQIGFTLMLTEGFGDLSMSGSTLKLLLALETHRVSLSGTTQVRAGVIRPELIGPPIEDRAEGTLETGTGIGVGTEVRIVRGAALGSVGRILRIPTQPVSLATGATALVYEIELSSKEVVIVPRPNVER